MPDFSGVAVAVVGTDGKAFKEWGVQKTKNRVTSCYIQSEKDKQFCIRITPHIDQWDATFAWKEYYGVHDMLATVRLDGQEKLERRAIVYLDKYHRYFNQRTHGEIHLDGKKIQDEAGNTRLYKWTFQEVGIELLLENLSLDTPAAAANTTTTTTTTISDEDHNTDPLRTAFSSLGSNNLADKEEPSTSGVIEVALEFIRIAAFERPRTDKNPYDHVQSATSSHAPAASSSFSSSSTKDQAHVAANTGGDIIKPSRHVIEYDRMFPDDPPHATYKFFYRSEEVLRKFDFAGFPVPAVPREDRIAKEIEKKRKVKEEGERVKGSERKEEEGEFRAKKISLPVMLKK
ncbi:hypothetical protein CERZMDRAFT_95826 [Cercospora zeae-maydis SCOH1-5]|uniref:DUF7918 domain-containing protein n=1 Tax=Cercospora zeae-maydis SCOH1-5 TaxID=717836 RepID=A0A6A6FK71_9PEZI|nr:hypothetical protein CERZMDRAFT_95826 [Cercospora zeae-maydis SCOH1-5]